MKYSWKKGLTKAIISVILVGIPMVLQILPTETLNLTLGGVLVIVLNYIKTVHIR